LGRRKCIIIPVIVNNNTEYNAQKSIPGRLAVHNFRHVKITKNASVDNFCVVDLIFSRPEDTHKGPNAGHQADSNLLYWTDEGNKLL